MLYGSESELDDSEDEAPITRTNAPSKQKGADQGVRIRMDDGEPMDLLQGAVSRITSEHVSFSVQILILISFYQMRNPIDVASPARMLPVLRQKTVPERW